MLKVTSRENQQLKMSIIRFPSFLLSCESHMELTHYHYLILVLKFNLDCVITFHVYLHRILKKVQLQNTKNEYLQYQGASSFYNL